MKTFIDPYQREALASWLTMPHWVVAGSMVGLFYRLGDRVAIGLSMVTDEAMLGDAKIASKIQRAIDFTFRDPLAIRECPIDRFPIYSVYLLEKIQKRVSDPETLAAVSDTLGTLRNLIAHGERGEHPQAMPENVEEE